MNLQLFWVNINISFSLSAFSLAWTTWETLKQTYRGHSCPSGNKPVNRLETHSCIYRRFSPPSSSSSKGRGSRQPLFEQALRQPGSDASRLTSHAVAALRKRTPKTRLPSTGKRLTAKPPAGALDTTRLAQTPAGALLRWGGESATSPPPTGVSPQRQAPPPQGLPRRAQALLAGTGPGIHATPPLLSPLRHPTRNGEVGERVGAQRRRQRAHPVRVAIRRGTHCPPPAALPLGRRAHPRPREPDTGRPGRATAAGPAGIGPAAAARPPYVTGAALPGAAPSRRSDGQPLAACCLPRPRPRPAANAGRVRGAWCRSVCAGKVAGAGTAATAACPLRLHHLTGDTGRVNGRARGGGGGATVRLGLEKHPPKCPVAPPVAPDRARSHPRFKVPPARWLSPHCWWHQLRSFAHTREFPTTALCGGAVPGVRSPAAVHAWVRAPAHAPLPAAYREAAVGSCAGVHSTAAPPKLPPVQRTRTVVPRRQLVGRWITRRDWDAAAGESASATPPQEISGSLNPFHRRFQQFPSPGGLTLCLTRHLAAR